MDRPFSVGPFEKRVAHMHARIVGGQRINPEIVGECIATYVDRPYSDQVAIRKGFVMPDSQHSNKKRRAEIQEKAESGFLDSYESMHLSAEEMDALVAWWQENKVN